jgi:hypothetical protein
LKKFRSQPVSISAKTLPLLSWKASGKYLFSQNAAEAGTTLSVMLDWQLQAKVFQTRQFAGK